MRPPTLTLAVLIVLALGAAAFGPCGGSAPSKKTPATHPLAEGATIGKIERSAGGTAVVVNVHTLLTLSCINGQLVVRTNLETLAGSMDCARMIPQSEVERFLGLPIVITYAGGRLRIESPTAGTLELPATDVSVSDVNATP